MNCNTAICIVNIPLFYTLLVVFEWVYNDQVAEQGIYVNTRSPCYNTYHLCQMIKCMSLYTYNGDLLKLKWPMLTYMHTFT